MEGFVRAESSEVSHSAYYLAVGLSLFPAAAEGSLSDCD